MTTVYIRIVLGMTAISILVRSGVTPELASMLVDLVRENRLDAAYELFTESYPTKRQQTQIYVRATTIYHQMRPVQDDTQILIEKLTTHFMSS